MAERPPDAFLTMSEAACYLACSQRYIRDLVRRGELHPDGRGRRRAMAFRRRTLDALLERGAQS